MPKTTVDDLAIVLSASSDQLAGDLRAAARLVEGFKKTIDKSGGPAGDVAGAKDAARTAEAHKKSARDIAAAYASAGGSSAASLAKIGIAAAATGGGFLVAQMAATGVLDVVDQLKDSVRMAADLEQTQLAFETMLGSASAGMEMVANLKKFAAETPFNNKEVIGAGRGLLAVGVAADQIIPTLRMLGDVSAAFGKDLSLEQLVGAYGRIYSTQRAYGMELRSIAVAGPPIYEELAKVIGVSVDEVHHLVEAGRVGRNEVTQAFQAMTGAGGRFFEMTKRQGQTLAGLWETASDAFQSVKIKLGQIIIEESGLKGVVGDLEKFANKIELGIDTNGIRQTIRFVSDLAKAAAQVSYEFVRAGISMASMGLESIGQSFPGIQKAAKSISDTLKDLQNFRIDRKALASVVLDFTEAIVVGVAQGIEWIEKMGAAIKKDFIDPVRSLLGDLTALREFWDKPLGKAPWHPAAMPPSDPDGGAKAIAQPLSPLLNDADIIRTYQSYAGKLKVVEDALATSKAKHPLQAESYFKELAEDVARAKKNRDDYVKKFNVPPEEAIKQLDQGVVPKKRTAEEMPVPKRPDGTPITMPPVNAPPKSLVVTAQEGFGRFKDTLMARLTGEESAREQEAARAKLGDLPQKMSGLAAMSALGPYAPLMPAMDMAREASGVRLQKGDYTGGSADLLKQLRERFDPLNPQGELMRHKADLDVLVKRGDIPKEWAQADWHDAVKSKADQLGVGGPTQLPEDVQRGSAEAMKIINNFQANGSQTVEGLLEAILNTLVGSKQDGKTLEAILRDAVSFPEMIFQR